MKSNPSHASFCQKRRFRVENPRGFALVVTLSLMILLTVIAVGLLGLSSISLRSSSQSDAMQSARANAKMALMLAIGDLQKQLGPDTRISATADQITAADPAVSTTPRNQRNWTGAYKSWAPGLPAAARPAPEFIQWFVSGDPSKILAKEFAGTAVTGKETVDIVSQNTVGPDDPVTVPKLTQTLSNASKNGMAWWVSDLGTKALIAPSKTPPTALGDVRADLQSIPTTNLKSAVIAAVKPFASVASDDPNLDRMYSWETAELLTTAGTPPDIRGLFHHYSTHNRGLLTNVREGGFRKDLSMALERPSNGSGATAPPGSNATALYKVGPVGSQETGINLQELWAYYNSYKEIKKSGSHPYSTGGTLATGSQYVLVDPTPTAAKSDDEFYLKQPVIISYQLVLSLRNANNRLELVADPIITLWNPLDVAVVIPAGQVLTVKYWQVPYDLMISKNGGATLSYPLQACLQDSTNTVDGDANFLSVRLGNLGRLVFKPGEVVNFSQSGPTLERIVGERHRLNAKAGFNYGGGVWVAVKDRMGRTIPLAPNDTIVMSAAPNQYTAGATKTSGATVETSGVRHTRHFSTTHHEYYYGEDRASNGDSLGIGTMAIDWDFGNRRLTPNEIRGENEPGTKPKNDRLAANMPRLKDIFKTTSQRTFPASGLIQKQPFMLLSYNAKTELGGTQKTKSLSRFNPKALHVDFYDLTEAERDILPYEFSVDSLAGWKSDKLIATTNGNAYFGGSLEANDGSSFVTTHSFPREPIYSLAAFQHSFANGFDSQKPKPGYSTINAREPLLPQISHAIGNSTAPSMLKSTQTEGTLSGARPIADHSYLANQGLWDTWFLSGIAPQNLSGTFSASKDMKTIASEFFSGKTKLNVNRYVPNPGQTTPAQILTKYFSGNIPKTIATDEIASMILVDGLFNVNSTSVEAWKSLLGSRQGRPVVVRGADGKDVIVPASTDVPVAGLLTPGRDIADGSGATSPAVPPQWAGRRALKEDEIDALARAIVKEVRKRGPFISLADFVNRRVGSDVELARAGAIQSALDSKDHKINDAFTSGSRAVSTAAANRMAFPEAEQGPISQGIPGIIKQADILTPIAPVLSARSDSFLVRAFGDKTDASGKVVARAWCEAIIQRSPSFVDPVDLPEKAYSSISTINRTFGRRFEIVSFRWLSASEI